MPVTQRLYEKSMSAVAAAAPPVDLLDYANKSVASWSTDNSNNISISFLTYDTNISKIITTGYNTSGWHVDWFAPLNNSGYAIFMYSTSGPQRWAVIFYDYEGTEIYRYEAETNSFDYDDYQGKFIWFIDNDNHKLVYTDGKTYQTYSYNSLNSIDILSWYSNVMDNGFIISENNVNGTDNLYTYSLATMDNGVVQLGPALNGNIEESGPIWNNNAKFILLFHNQLPGTNQFISIFSNTGQFIRDIFLPTDHVYNNWNIDFYGTNKASILFYNSGDNTIPYLIYNYDGNSDKLLMTHHDRYPHFSDYEVYYSDHYNSRISDDYLSEDIHYIFYGNIDGWDNDLLAVGYADVLSVFNGDTEFRSPYVINNTGDPHTSIGIYNNFIGSSFIMPVVNYNDSTPKVKLLNIQKSSTSYKDIRPVSELNGLNIWYDNAGDNYILALFTTYISDGTVYVFDGKTGNLRDSKVFTSNINWWYRYDTIYFQDYGQEGNISWYINSVSSKFQPLEYSNNVNIYTPSDYVAGPPYNTPGNVVLYNYSTGVTRVITRTNFYTFTLPVSGDYDIAIGNDVILYAIYPNNLPNISLYNLKGQFQQANVNLPYWSTSYFNVVGNRAYFSNNNGNDTKTNYILKPGSVKSSTLSDYNNNLVPNDYYYWND